MKAPEDFHAKKGDIGNAGSGSNDADRHGAKPKANSGNTGMQAENPEESHDRGGRYEATYETHQHQKEDHTSPPKSGKTGIYGEHQAPHADKQGAKTNEPGGLYSEGSEVGRPQRDPHRKEELKNSALLEQRHVENSGGDSAGKHTK